MAYPKDFVWSTWHPHCRCYAVPILKTEDEMDEPQDKPSANEVRTLPEGFVRWAQQNAKRLERMNQRGSTPLFIKENTNYLRLAARNQQGEKTRLTLTSEQKAYRKQLQNEAREKLKTITINNEIIQVSNAAIKEWINQPHKHYILKNEALLNIEELLRQGSFVGNGIDRHDPNLKVYLYQVMIGGDASWVIIRGTDNGTKWLHSISDNPSIIEKAIKK